MNPQQTKLACYGLIASAFVLAGLALANLDGRFESEAQADMVIARDNFTLMTAPTRPGEEALFVLDNSSGRLLVYQLNVPRKQIDRVAGVDIGEIFARGGAGEQAPRGR